MLGRAPEFWLEGVGVEGLVYGEAGGVQEGGRRGPQWRAEQHGRMRAAVAVHPHSAGRATGPHACVVLNQLHHAAEPRHVPRH